MRITTKESRFHRLAFILPYAYTTSAEKRFSRNAFLVVTLALLVTIDLVCLLLLAIFPQAPWLGWIAIVNTAGASGDLWITALLLRCPGSVMVGDRREGIAIYAPSDGDVRSLPLLLAQILGRFCAGRI